MIEKGPPKQLHIALLFLYSFLLFGLAVTLNQTLRWTDHWMGFMNGVFHTRILGFAWLIIYIAPWALSPFFINGENGNAFALTGFLRYRFSSLLRWSWV